MTIFVIDCSKIKTESEFWTAYINNVEVSSQDDFGRNLDALWDALQGNAPGSPIQTPCTIRIKNTDTIKKLRDGYFYDHLRQIAHDLKSDPGSNVRFLMR